MVSSEPHGSLLSQTHIINPSYNSPILMHHSRRYKVLQHWLMSPCEVQIQGNEAILHHLPRRPNCLQWLHANSKDSKGSKDRQKYTNNTSIIPIWLTMPHREDYDQKSINCQSPSISSCSRRAFSQPRCDLPWPQVLFLRTRVVSPLRVYLEGKHLWKGSWYIQ